MIGPRRSLWAIIVTPLALLYTVFQLTVAAHHLPYLRTFILLGVVLCSFYVVWFCWNVFGRQELQFSEGDMTISRNLLGLRHTQRVGVGDINGRQLLETGYRIPSCVIFEVRTRKLRTASAKISATANCFRSCRP